MSRRRSEQITPLFPATAPAGVAAPPLLEAVPPGHPLLFWTVEEAAEKTTLSVSTLLASECPRINCGRRVIFDPITTVAWMRRKLSNAPPSVG